MFQNAAEVQAYIKENGIRFVDFKMIDLHGRWRHLCIPAGRLLTAYIRKKARTEG